MVPAGAGDEMRIKLSCADGTECAPAEAQFYVSYSMPPSSAPTSEPSACPTVVPTSAPSSIPTSTPSSIPTSAPSPVPSPAPSPVPTVIPTSCPTSTPTVTPTALPTATPTACFLDITGIGSGFTCIAGVECTVTWDFRGSGCATVQLEAWDDHDTFALINSAVLDNDGEETSMVPASAGDEMRIKLSCADGTGCASAEAQFYVSYSMPPSVAPSTSEPSASPTACFLEIDSIGTIDTFTCVAGTRCVAAWTHSGDADACGDVVITVRAGSAADDDAALVVTSEYENDGRARVFIPPNANADDYVMTLASVSNPTTVFEVSQNSSKLSSSDKSRFSISLGRPFAPLRGLDSWKTLARTRY